jgi:4'-phosphopantetheinyl transferase
MGCTQDIWGSSRPRLLQAGEIDVWSTCLRGDSSSIQALFEILSPDERQKANKYVFAKDRDRFVVARGTLRKILGGYLTISPSRVSFSYNRYGKPFLDVEDRAIRFNVSHSQELALFAVTREQEVGIDVEFIDDRIAILKTAQSVFSPTEISKLEALPANLQTAAFFSGWTRKEAILKAMGEGFSFPAKQLTISELFGESKISFSIDKPDWSLMSLPSEPNYMAALAVEGKIGTIRYLDWSED